MAEIDQVKLPNGNIYDIHDKRIPGIDSTPTSGSTNVVTSDGIYQNSPFIPGTGTGSAVLKGGNNAASGNYSVAEGVYTKASGSYSHAEGGYTTASGIYSHAEGYSTKATGSYSHAEEYYTTASGQYSHAEGYYTTASGYTSHAEGQITVANGTGSHAEGTGSRASGSYSHAEGHVTTASGTGSHAEGYNTETGGDYEENTKPTSSNISSGSYAHAEGNATIAQGAGSHAEGQRTLAIGVDSHVEGVKTLTALLGIGAHAEGYYTTAEESYSHAEGYQSSAKGKNSHAEGSVTTASGGASHTEGFHTIAKNNREHAQGSYNISNTGSSSTFGNTGSTIFSIGIGTTESDRKNALEVMQSGQAYLYGLGSYNGTNPVSGTNDIKTIIDSKTSNTGTVTSVSAGTGLIISGSATTTPTVSISSSYKLPTTTEWNDKAPVSHSSTSSTYGLGNTTSYGHVKIKTGDLNGVTSSSGEAAASAHSHSQYAVTGHTHSYLPLSGGVMDNNATIKLNKYGVRTLTIGGNDIVHDFTQDTGGYAGSFYSLKTKASDNTDSVFTGIGFYGGYKNGTGLHYIYSAAPSDSYLDPTFKITSDGYVAAKREITAAGFKTPSGTAAQFLKANGTVDSTAYLPLTGGTMSGTIFASGSSDAMMFLRPSSTWGGWARDAVAIGPSGSVITFGGYGNTGSSMLYAYIGAAYNNGHEIRIKKDSDPTVGTNSIWHAGNDGSGSGLDADLLDGQHASYFAPLASPTFSGTASAPTPNAGTNNTQIATTAFVKTAVESGIATSDAMVYKGTMSGGSTGAYGALTPSASCGWTYKVTTAGKIDGVSVEVGDMLVCNTDNTAAATSTNYATIATKWDFIQGNLDGVVIGPASVTASHVAIFDGTTGKLIKDSGFTISKSVPSDALFTDHTYTASSGITLSGSTFKHTNAVTAGTAGTSSATSGSTIAVPYVGYDAQGHVTASGTHTHTVNNLPWNSITSKPTTLAGYGITDAKIASGVITLGNNSITPVTIAEGVDTSADHVAVFNDDGSTELKDSGFTIATSVPSGALFTDHTYTASAGITLSGSTFKHTNAVTAGTAGTSAATSGSTLAVPYVGYDAQGHVTSSGTHTHTITGFASSSHTHGNITNDGKIGTASGKPLITTTSGSITTGSFGTASGTFAEGNHHHSISITETIEGGEVGLEYGKDYILSAGGTEIVFSMPSLGTSSLQAAAGNHTHYIGTTQVQTASATQSLTGIVNIDSSNFKLGQLTVGTRSNLLLNSPANTPADIIFRSGTYSTNTWGDWAISSRGNNSSDSGSKNAFVIARGGQNTGVTGENICFKISPNTKMIIGSSIFNTEPGYQLHVVGDMYASTDITSGGDIRAKGNDLYVGSASNSQCHQQYDATNKCLKFIFD